MHIPINLSVRKTTTKPQCKYIKSPWSVDFILQDWGADKSIISIVKFTWTYLKINQIFAWVLKQYKNISHVKLFFKISSHRLLGVWLNISFPLDTLRSIALNHYLCSIFHMCVYLKLPNRLRAPSTRLTQSGTGKYASWQDIPQNCMTVYQRGENAVLCFSFCFPSFLISDCSQN